MTGTTIEFATAFRAGGPMHDERRTDAALVDIVLVEPPGRVAGVGPTGAVAEETPWPAHPRQVVAAVQDIRGGGRAEVDARARLWMCDRLEKGKWGD